MVQHPLFGEVSKNFNETAALEAYEAFKSDPEYYHVLLQMHAHDVVSEIKFTHPEVIDELITKKFEARKAVIKDAVLSGVINKSMTNSTVDEIVSTMDKIQKDISGYTEWERAANTKGQRRDPRGRFVPMGKTVIANPNPKSVDKNDLDRLAGSYDKVTAVRFPDMLPEATGKKGNKTRKIPTIQVNPEMNVKHSAAYLQVAEALNKIDPGELVMGDVTWERRTPNAVAGGPMQIEHGKTTIVGSTPEEFVRQPDYERNKYITKINWYMDFDGARGGGYDLLTGAGMAGSDYLDVAGMTGRAADGGGFSYNAQGEQSYEGRTGALYNYNRQIAANPNTEYGTGAGFNRLASTAEMVDTIGGDALSGKAKWALGAAKYVGDHGPEAEKVLGPTARRSAYRYRGVERKPDAKLERSIATSIQGAKSIEDAREMLIHPGTSDNLAGNPKKPDSLRLEQDMEFSPFIRYWQSQLPKKENLNLHLNSGAIAPSQGIVFDAKGQVVTQAVGYGDDHYLPFNLKNLSRANRGEWVRTRTMGGPTTEDIYAALTTGTRSITVVSHSGVYNVEFDESFRGSRRYNDKSARMVRRYSQLLDTLEAENTTLADIPSDRKAEFRAKAEQMYRGDSESAVRMRNNYIGELKRAERSDPKPSQERVDDWSAEFGTNIAEQYAERYASNRNFPDTVSWDQLKASQSVKAGRLLTDLEAIESLNLGTQYNKFLEFKKSEYRSQQQPLKLNGQGYYFALQALQEQFPYDIKRVEWYPPNEPQYDTDKGYVKRNFLRSANIAEGYWDPEIEGHKGKTVEVGGKKKQTGKEQANHMNYQNMANRQAVGANSDGVDSNFLSDKKLTPTYGGDPGNPSSASSGGSGGANTNPQSTTTSAEGGATYGSNLARGIPGTGVRLTRGGESQQTPESVAAIIKLGDALEAKGSQDLQTGARVNFGTSAHPDMPWLTNWQATREQITFGNIDHINGAAGDLENIFEKMATSAAQSGPFVSSIRSEMGGIYNNELKNKMMRPPKSAVEAVSESNQNQVWSLGPQFVPGRQINDYFNAQRDSDILAFRDRAPLFKNEAMFRNQVNAADAAVRTMRDGNNGFIYGNQTYYIDDRANLAKDVENDVYGYLKAKALNREDPTIPGPFETAGESIPDNPAEAEKITRDAKKDDYLTTDQRRAKFMADGDNKRRKEEAQRALTLKPLGATGYVPSDNGSGPSAEFTAEDLKWLNSTGVLKSHGVRLVPLRRGNG